jgi:hypothetical protein
MTTAIEEIVEARFDVSEGAELELHNVAGRITIRAHSEPAIAMRARKHGDEHSVANTRIETDQLGKQVVIRTTQQNDIPISDRDRGNSLCAVDYDLLVPRGCSFDIDSVSAGIDVEGTDGSARLNSVSGELHLRGARGDISLKSVSGSITAFGLEGELAASSTSGEVSVLDSNLRRFTLNTVSGYMTVDTPLTAGESYRITTVSGNLTLRVPAETGAKVSLSSVSGSIRADGAIRETSGPGRRSWSGTIGDGGADLSMNSVSGSMTIVTNEAV